MMSKRIPGICTVLFALWFAAPAALQAQAQRIIEWVEDAPANDNTVIALGYPVPIPVDTPLPFAGFRSYNGLHMRHQDLAVSTPWVHPIELGQTTAGRTIWAYQLGDPDHETWRGIPEQAMLSNGGIHAREWQSPEVTTGIIELLALAEDNHLVDYLRDNANILVIPVLNVDGFLQTQRYPTQSWMGTDPDDPGSSPRDGRMRRKNMLNVDEDMLTSLDHLFGVDLNRNNPPYFGANPLRSSPVQESIVHRGSGPHSELETQALEAAAQLGPANRLSMYTDLHSFSQVHFWGRNELDRLARLTDRLLTTFSNHHREFDAGKNYVFSTWVNTAINQGIGTTDEYFLHQYLVPSWTLEIEPSNGASYHSPLPGQGADYGGLGRNGHDGFILPESEVERVRTELAQTFAVAYYQQAGPPSVTAVRITDEASGAVVFEAEWDTVDERNRSLHRYQAQPLQVDRNYIAWVAWDKPMRWRTDGTVTVLPGQPAHTLNFERGLMVGDQVLNTVLGNYDWMNEAGGAPAGFQRYRDDAASFPFNILGDDANLELVQGPTSTTLELDSYDMTGFRGDADPSTVAYWRIGAWGSYEDSSGAEGSDSGGVDKTIQFDVTSDDLGDPFVVEPGTSAAWYDVSRSGEGFILEVISPTRAILFWFTYDENGAQDWYFADGEIRGNRALFPDLLRVSGGEFGPGFDPDKVVRTTVGSASFTWGSCNAGVMNWIIDQDGGSRRQGRMDVSRLTRVMGMPCTQVLQPPLLEQMLLSGSWFDPTHSGEGYTIEVLSNQDVLVFWFSFDPEGNRRWFYGVGQIEGEKIVFPKMYTTLGALFGPEFDPDAVEVNPWGTLELELSCMEGIARFEPEEEGFPAGTLDLDRLTLLEGLSCDEG